MLSSSRTPPSTGTSQTSPENKVRLRCMKSARCAEFNRFKTKESEMRMTVILCLIVYSPFFFFFALLFVLPSRFYSINDPHVPHLFPSHLLLLLPLFSPHCSLSFLRLAAINLLKDREPGAFIIRDSHSFRGAYGLAMKVACPPPTVQQNKKGKDTNR